MGIPSYFMHIVRKYRNIIIPLGKIDSTRIDNLYMDCNGFVYNACKELEDEGACIDISSDKNNEVFETKLIELTCVRISELILSLNPSGNVMIAFDGVPPMAKIKQQRTRRCMASMDRLNQADNTGNNKQTKPNMKFWNTSAITPGTKFMNKLDNAVIEKFTHNSNSNNSNNSNNTFNVKQIIISGSDISGEGEHKIFEHIRDNPEYHKTGSTVIYGMDADLIMLSLNHIQFAENLFLFRETPEFIKQIDNTLCPNTLYLFDIRALGTKIKKELSQNSKSNKNNINSDKDISDDVIHDYIFMCFMLGNDFLPHFPALNIRTDGIRRLISTYNILFGTLISGNTLTVNKVINWSNVKRFIEHLASYEHEYILEEYDTRDRAHRTAVHVKGRSSANDRLNIPLRDRDIENYINPRTNCWENRYYSSLFSVMNSYTDVTAVCINYLEGLEWVMSYYSTGCVNWEWVYKYNYPPLLKDLAYHTLEPNNNNNNNNNNNDNDNKYRYITYKEKTTLTSLTPLTQLSYVLPLDSLFLLPSAIKDRLLKTHPEWYTEHFKYHWSFCKFLWEAHPLLPEINMDELKRIVIQK